MSILHHLLLTLFCVCIISDSVHSSHEINPLPPCELVFPKQGDELIHSGHTYSLLMCHFSPAAELLLNETLRQYSVVVRALAIEPHSMQYKKAFEFPPVTSYSPVMDDVKLTTISEFFLPSAPFQLDIRYKLVYEVYIGDTIMDQVTTVVTYKDSDYFRAQLGLQKINLVDVEKLCENENESDTCSLLDSVCDSLFTQRFDFIEVGESVSQLGNWSGSVWLYLTGVCILYYSYYNNTLRGDSHLISSTSVVVNPVSGTSAFDTCLQKAESHHRGISVEPVSYYQDMLPSPPGVIKENAAIDAKQMDSEVDFGLMYYLDPNDLLAHGIAMDGPYYYMYGISSFGSIQANLLNSYRLEAKYDATPSIFLQRSRLVPRLSMEELYTKHAVREVRSLSHCTQGHLIQLSDGVANLGTQSIPLTS